MSENNDQPDIEAEFKTWKAAPSVEANAHILTSLQPTIDRATRSIINNPSPIVKSKARLLTLQSLNTYDPNRGRLTSHIYNHMQGLRRYVGQMSAGIHVPERQALDRQSLLRAGTELNETLGRDPTDDELTDYTGLSSRRIGKIRAGASGAIASGSFEQTGEDRTPFDPAVRQNGSPSKAWLTAIYDDLSPLDKKVMEWGIGYNGNAVLANQDIAKRLRRTPGWVSQRKMAIQQMFDQEYDLSPFGGGQ
jgi:DNA-directed RNA polymerase specialized sigma subunit